MDDKKVSVLKTRRDFIRQAACAAIGTTALTSIIRDLRFINSAVAQTGINDYKALVCVFLAGGNDSNNMIVPTLASEYTNYSKVRTPVLALPSTSLLPITSLVGDGHTYGLHPSMTNLQTLFGQGKLAVLFNTGTLAYPLTKTQYFNGSKPKPSQLFSHADQVTQWQTSIPDQTSLTGWGGRCADLLNSVQPGAPISLNVTLAGANTFEVGNLVTQYSVSTAGGIALSGVSGSRLTALTNILGLPYQNMQEQAYAGVAAHTINTTALLNNAISNTAAASYWNPQFPGTITPPTGGTPFGSSLGPQLRMIARLIAAGSTAKPSGFGMKRQIFFCSVGGYDLLANQTPGPGQTTIGSHANLLAEIDQCLNAFYQAMVLLGLQNNVTAFTSSDFGRTFPSNGVGSDHGWGSHHLILGGAVKGQQTYGTFPSLVVNGPDDTGTGRWIPTTAIDQYFAALATWFGVDNSNLATVFPNLSRFPALNPVFI